MAWILDEDQRKPLEVHCIQLWLIVVCIFPKCCKTDAQKEKGFYGETRMLLICLVDRANKNTGA